MTSGFFESLFDFSFNKLVTTKVAKVVYVLAVIAISLWSVVILIAGLGQGGAAAFASIIGAPLMWIFAVVAIRIYLEVVIILFKISENTYNIHATLASGGAAGAVPTQMPPAAPPVVGPAATPPPPAAGPETPPPAPQGGEPTS